MPDGGSSAAVLAVFPLPGGLLALNPTNGVLQAVEGLGAWLLLGWQQGLDAAQLHAEHAAAFPDTRLTLAALQKQFHQLRAAFATPPEDNAYRQEYQAVLASPVDPARDGEGMGLNINGFRVQVISPDYPALLAEWQRLCAWQMLATPFRPHAQFVIHREAGGHFSLDCNGQSLCTGVTETATLPVLMDLIQILSYQRGDYLLAVHAAVLAKAGRTLILPGLSGAGKSTLCTHLATQGFTVYSDELAVLCAPDASAQPLPLPLPLAVKSGSWELLHPHWPELVDAPVWERPDGRRLKYLALPEHARPTAQAEPGTARHYVVFPHYDPDCVQPQWQPLTELELLSGLTQAGYQLPRAPDAASVERLLAFACNTPAYRLRYASLEAAQCLILQWLESP